jgi:hypothetical protein
MPQLSDTIVRRRFRETTVRLERFGADESVARFVASTAQHIESTQQGRVEPHELAALSGVLTLVLRNASQRAEREQGLMEAIA